MAHGETSHRWMSEKSQSLSFPTAPSRRRGSRSQQRQSLFPEDRAPGVWDKVSSSMRSFFCLSQRPQDVVPPLPTYPQQRKESRRSHRGLSQAKTVVPGTMVRPTPPATRRRTHGHMVGSRGAATEVGTLVERLRTARLAASAKEEGETRGGLVRDTSRSSLVRTPDSDLSLVSSKAPTALSTPMNPRQTNLFKHYCPICMRYFKEIYVTSCCNHSVCKTCAMGYIEGPQEGQDSYFKDCMFCKKAAMRLVEVASCDGKTTRNYEDSPAVAHTPGTEPQTPIPSPSEGQQQQQQQQPDFGSMVASWEKFEDSTCTVTLAPAPNYTTPVAARSRTKPVAGSAKRGPKRKTRKHRRVKPFPSLGPPDTPQPSARHLNWEVDAGADFPSASPDASAPTA